MALADARAAGVEVPADVYRELLEWLDTDPGGATAAAAALRTACRIFCGTTERDPHLVADRVLLEKADAPGTGEDETEDAQVRYFATIAEFYWGGDAWNGRRRIHAERILPRQRREQDGCLLGSWDPGGDAVPGDDRVAATALTAMLFDAAYISTYRNGMKSSLLPK
jgi:hypothetical protein